MNRQTTSPRIQGFLAAALLHAAVILSPTAVQASEASARAADTSAAEEVAEPGSPRVALARFLDFCRSGNYGEAARLLDLSHAEVARGADLARRLKLVLDRYVGFDLDTISGLPGGNAQDGLPPGVDEIARIPGAAHGDAAVRLVRQADSGQWQFSRGTVARIDAWYAQLDGLWIREILPARLLLPGPGNILYWQWLALPMLFVGAWLMAMLLTRLSRRILGRIATRTSTRWDDELLARMGGPLTLAWTLVLVYVSLPWLGLYQPAQVFLGRILRGGFLVVLFWALARAVEVARQVLTGAGWTADRPGMRSLLPLGARVAKVIVVLIGVVALLSELGYSVASLVAGLGIGGLAVALAAQKTVENLFGAFSIGADQPIREGDFVRVEDTVGTVEAIGLRSTRIRTLDRTLVSYPNAKLADMRLESFAARDRIRLACTIGLEYATTQGQMREALAGIERVLREQPKIWPDAVVVRFVGFGDSSLNIDVMAWFQTADWNEFQGIRQDVLLQFMAVVEKAGSSFAFPTRTVHLARPAH
jgi:MscS family membrane protein